MQNAGLGSIRIECLDSSPQNPLSTSSDDTLDNTVQRCLEDPSRFMTIPMSRTSSNVTRSQRSYDTIYKATCLDMRDKGRLEIDRYDSKPFEGGDEPNHKSLLSWTFAHPVSAHFQKANPDAWISQESSSVRTSLKIMSGPSFLGPILSLVPVKSPLYGSSHRSA